MMHVIVILFYGMMNENVLISIGTHLDYREGRERHPGGVQQDKT